MAKRNTMLRAVRRLPALLLVSAALPPAPVMLAVVPAAAQNAIGLANPGSGSFTRVTGLGIGLATLSVLDRSGSAPRLVLRAGRGRGIRPWPGLHHEFTNPMFDRYGPDGVGRAARQIASIFAGIQLQY